LSLRARITAGALVVVAGALSVGGMTVINTTEREMTSQIDAALRADADFTERMITRGSGLPVGEGPTDLYVQFVDADRKVVAAGTAALGRPALSAPGQAVGSITDVTDPRLGRLRVLVEDAPNEEELTLVLARSSRNVAAVHASQVRLLTVLAVAGSALLAFLVWFVVGRALRPVEQMRAVVENLDDGDLSTRVDLPGTRDELDRLARTLNELLARLETAVSREREFVADASHDLRTPIAAVRALLEAETTDPAMTVLTRADALARLDHLQGLVDDLLTLSRADSADPPPNTPVDLDELVLGQARQLSRGTVLRVDTTRVSGGQVSGRDTDLARLVQNLATNAARHAHSTVAFAVHQFDEMVELVVDDDGPGIDPRDRDRVFERFRALDDVRTGTTSGSGLGLAIVATIVSAHHGTVRVGDAPGGGARFEVRLPAYLPTPLPGQASAPTSPASPPAARPAG
jgi:signal transduction histidine kinase